jgi:hypothetical protein
MQERYPQDLPPGRKQDDAFADRKNQKAAGYNAFPIDTTATSGKRQTRK